MTSTFFNSYNTLVLSNVSCLFFQLPISTLVFQQWGCLVCCKSLCTWVVGCPLQILLYFRRDLTSDHVASIDLGGRFVGRCFCFGWCFNFFFLQVCLTCDVKVIKNSNYLLKVTNIYFIFFWREKQQIFINKLYI